MASDAVTHRVTVTVTQKCYAFVFIEEKSVTRHPRHFGDARHLFYQQKQMVSLACTRAPFLRKGRRPGPGGAGRLPFGQQGAAR